MTIQNAAERLMQAVQQKISVLLNQEKILKPEEEHAEGIRKCKEEIEKVKRQLEAPENLLEKLRSLSQGLQDICNPKPPADLKITQQTLLLRHKKKNFILSTNIPRPQIDFKDRGSKYTLDAPVAQEGEAEECVTEEEVSDVIRSIKEQAKKTKPSKTVSLVLTEAQLVRANAEIEKEKIVAVDVKNHAFRSYKGFLCYIQVCTPNTVYLIDSIALHNSLSAITFLFSPAITKIFFDLPKKKKWISRDFGKSPSMAVDVRSMLPPALKERNLNQCLNHYLNRDLKNGFILLDWRYRDMTEEMQAHLKNKVEHLIPLASVLIQQHPKDAEAGILARTAHPKKEEEIDHFAKRYSLPPSRSLLEVLRLREFIARQEDESRQFVLTDRQVSLLVEHAPKTPIEVFRLLPRISSLFKANLNNFLRVIHPEGRPGAFSLHDLKAASGTA